MGWNFARAVKFEGTASLDKLGMGTRRWDDERPDLGSFDFDKKYTPKQLDDFASEIIRLSFMKTPVDHYPVVLLNSHLDSRYRREIYNTNGVPDPSHAGGYYWRTHPRGRKFRSKEQTEAGMAFYG